MIENGATYCGKEGRQARAYVRAMLADDFIPAMMGYKMNGLQALAHADSCSNCHRKIGEQVLNNPTTAYSSTVEKTLLEARQTYLKSEQRFVYSELTNDLVDPERIEEPEVLINLPVTGILNVTSAIRALVPAGIENSLHSRELNFRNLPHLQKVAILTHLLLNAKEHFYEDSGRRRVDVVRKDFEEVKKKKKEAGEEGDGVSLGDLMNYSEDYLKTWLELDERDRERLPEIVAEKINEKDNPFGLRSEVVRAILEMANDFYETQLYVDSIKIGTYDPNWQPVPTEYLTDVMEEMFEEGRLSGRNPFSRTKFPAGNYFDEIFTPEASRQMQNLIRGRRKR